MISQIKRLLGRGTQNQQSPYSIVHMHRNGNSVTTLFQSQYRLNLIPFLSYNDLAGLNSAVLYGNQGMSAIAIGRTGRYSDGDTEGFWSPDARVSQKELARYWEAVIRHADRGMDADQHKQYCWRVATQEPHLLLALQKDEFARKEQPPHFAYPYFSF